jgi:hypothetical protein
MITIRDIERQRRYSELIVLQTLKLRGEVNVMKSTSECRRLYNAEGRWFDRMVAAGLLVGVKSGKATFYSLEQILALQVLQLDEAARQKEEELLLDDELNECLTFKK